MALLHNFLETHNLHISYPKPSNVSCGGKWGQWSKIYPISWVPTGNKFGYGSLLDLAAGSYGVVKESKVSWACAPGDHGFLSFTVSWQYVKKCGHPRSWQPSNECE
eukprot:11656800-Karenia_brevis.AAC.1